MSEELRSRNGFRLIGASEDLSSTPISITKYFSLIELILPIMWIFAACVGNYASTLIHYVLLIFYTIGMNSALTLEFSLKKWPLLVVLFSTIYSFLYTFGEIALYIISPTNEFFQSKIASYLDMFTSDSDRDLSDIYCITQYIIAIIDVFYLAARNSVSVNWFSRSKVLLARKFMPLVRIIYVFSFAIMCAGASSIPSYFIAPLYGIAMIIISCLNKPFPLLFAKISWIILLIADTVFIAFEAGPVIISDISYPYVPRTVVIIFTFINAYIICMLIGFNRYTNSTKIRLLTTVVMPSVVAYLAPYVVIIISCSFCLINLTWQSLGCLVVACFTTFFGAYVLNNATPFVFVITTIAVCFQNFIIQITTKEGLPPPNVNFVLYILVAVASIFTNGEPEQSLQSIGQQRVRRMSQIQGDETHVSNTPSTRPERTQIIYLWEDKPWVVVVKQIIITIIVYALLVASIIFGTLYSYVTYSACVLLTLIIVIFRLYNQVMWTLLMITSFLSLVFNCISFILPGGINISWLINTQAAGRTIFEECWPFVMLFVLAALCRYYFREPGPFIISFIDNVLVFILFCFLIVFSDSSIFNLLYQLAFILFLFIKKSRKIILNSTSVLVTIHIVIMHIFSFPDFRDLISNDLVFNILGISPETLNIVLPSGVGILFICCVSYANKFQNLDSVNATLPNWAKSIVDHFWFILVQFSFYFFWIAIYCSILAANQVFIIGSLFTLILAITKIFSKNPTNFIGRVLFYIYVVDVFFMTTLDFIDISTQFRDIIELIGPFTRTADQKFINVCVSLTAFLYSSDNSDFELNHYVFAIGKIFASVLLPVVQLCLTIVAINELNAMSIIGSFLMFIILLKPKVTSIGAKIYSVLLTILLAYTLTFQLVHFSPVNEWTDYLLLTNTRIYEFTMIFLALISFTLYNEFGSLNVNFGPTFFTAYAPSFVIAIVSILSMTSPHYFVFAHTLIIIYNILQTSINQEFHTLSLNIALYFSFFSIFVMALRSLPFIPDSWYSTIDSVIGTYDDTLKIKWSFIFTFEFLLRCIVSSPEYTSIHANELERKQNRIQRAGIISQIIEINDKFSKANFNKKINSLKSGFTSLSQSVDAMANPKVSGSSSKIKSFQSSILIPSLEDVHEHTNEQNQENNNEEISNTTSVEDEFYDVSSTDTIGLESSSDIDETYASGEEEISESHDTRLMQVIKYILSFLKKIALFCVDSILRLILYFTDVNLDTGIHKQLSEKIKDFCQALLDSFNENNAFNVPEQWRSFIPEIPHSYFMQFQILHLLDKHTVNRKNRWHLVVRYLKIASRQFFPFLLVVLCVFYPLVEPNIIGVSYFLVMIICISSDIESYLPYIVLSLIIMFYRALTNMNTICDFAYDFANSIEEKQRPLKISHLISLFPSLEARVYEFLVYLCVLFSSTYSFTHIFQTRRANQHRTMPNEYYEQYDSMPWFRKFSTRFTHTSSIKLSFSRAALVLDIISFIVVIFFYNSWAHSTSINSMISGTSSVTVDYVILMIGHFVLILFCQIFDLSDNAIGLLTTNTLFVIFTFFYLILYIPYRSQENCFSQFFFYLYLCFRVIASFLYSMKLLCGFQNLPPHISRRQPLIQWLSSIIVLAVPFLFEFICCIKWLASKTAISIFDSLVIEEVKIRLIKQRNYLIILPPNSETKGKTIGYLLLLLLVVLLFIPFLIMMGSTTTSQPNPVKIASISAGILGLPNFYEGSYTTSSKDTITSEEQTAILSLGDTLLSPFYDNSLESSQYFTYPPVTMTNWLLSSSSIDYYLDTYLETNDTEITPFITATYQFTKTTTKNSVDTVTLTKYGSPLDDETKETLRNALYAVQEGTMDEPISLTFPKLIPLMTLVPLDSSAEFLTTYTIDAVFSLNISGNIPVWNVVANVTNPSNFPSFVESGAIPALIYSQPSFDALVSTLLSSTGGFLGLYAFVIITIGQFVRMFINSFFDDLWIDRMPNTEKLLNVILAIEAYRDAGDLETEYTTSVMFLNAVRSKHNIIKLTGMLEP